jgi:hypothetical protein
VNAILGSPQSCDEALGFKSCQWGDEKSNVTARFVAGKQSHLPQPHRAQDLLASYFWSGSGDVIRSRSVSDVVMSGALDGKHPVNTS